MCTPFSNCKQFSMKADRTFFSFLRVMNTMAIYLQVYHHHFRLWRVPKRHVHSQLGRHSLQPVRPRIVPAQPERHRLRTLPGKHVSERPRSLDLPQLSRLRSDHGDRGHHVGEWLLFRLRRRRPRLVQRGRPERRRLLGVSAEHIFRRKRHYCALQTGSRISSSKAAGLVLHLHRRCIGEPPIQPLQCACSRL